MISRAEIYELFDVIGDLSRRHVKFQLAGKSLDMWLDKLDLTKDVDLVSDHGNMYVFLDELSIRDVAWFYIGYNPEYRAHHFGVDLRKYTDHYIPLDIFVQDQYACVGEFRRFGNLTVYTNDRQIR